MAKIREAVESTIGTSDSPEQIMSEQNEAVADRIKGELAVTVRKEVRVKAEESFRWAVVLKLCNGNSFNAPAMLDALKTAWNIKDELGYQEMAYNRMVVKLRNEEEQRRILEGGPWTFMGWAVTVERWRVGSVPMDYNSNVIRMWVQIHNIPVEYRESNTPRELADLAGKVIKDDKHDDNKDAARRKWDRFRVEVEVDKPIFHGVFLAEEDREPVWIEYKYERLLMLCFKCGRLTHESNKCEFASEYQPDKRRFGKWLRADNQRVATAHPMALGMGKEAEVKENQTWEEVGSEARVGAFQKQLMASSDMEVQESEDVCSLNTEKSDNSLMKRGETDIAGSAKGSDCLGVKVKDGSSDMEKEVLESSANTVLNSMGQDGAVAAYGLSSLGQQSVFAGYGLKSRVGINRLGKIPIRRGWLPAPPGAMIVFSWNCQGLGRPRTVRALREAIKSHSPQIVCLLETKKRAVEVEGGLAILWDDSVGVENRNYSFFHIDVVIKEQEEFRLSIFYGNPSVSKRKESWNLLRQLRSMDDLQWVVIGDFNEVLSLNEVKSGRMRNQWQIDNFRKVVEDCHLIDLGFIGYPYTFSNHRVGEEEFQARLDRALADEAWMRKFPRALVSHLHLHASDHQLILLDTDSSCKDYSKMMDDFWSKYGDTRDGWAGKLSLCKEMLKSWSRLAFGDMRRKIHSIKQDLEAVKSCPRTAEMVEKERSLSEELDRWLVREETFWMQRSRVMWLNHGDKNTKFFHAKANQRRKFNRIAKLQDLHGAMQDDQNKIVETITSHFSDLFQSTIHGSAEVLCNQLDCISPVISEDMNSILLQDITVEEIKAAVFSLGPFKSPGIDGFPAVFYQRHWESIKNHVVKEVKEFWATGHLDRRINKTLIVLIPKKKEAVRVEDWRPISLCTPILSQVISCHQSAFVKGRIITDNLVVAHEIAHFLKSRRDDHRFFASFKVDMSKAYDRVEWPFLENLLNRMGFAPKWIDRVMTCVRTVSYQIKVNGGVSKVIWPNRGLRQGDPLSPYLFPFCTEWLSAKIMEAVSRKNITGISICRKAPVISHLFFADDSIFYLKAERGEAETLQHILRLYEFVSGQRINCEKSEICFSRNTPVEVRLSICDILKVPQVGCHSKYLGLPLLAGQKKSELFRCIVDKIWSKVKDWKYRLLSAGGREVLVKAVIQAIPTYMMSVYSFPRKIIAEINKLMLQFWWDKKGSGKGINWISLNTMQKKKCEGGLGLKDLAVFNEAMLLKIAWRIGKQPELILSRVLLAKYCKNGNIFDARLGSNPSHIWRGVMKSMSVFLKGLWWDEEMNIFRWKFSSTGNFTVKSAYEVIKYYESSCSVEKAEQSDKSGLWKFWKKLWSTNVPNKIKVFCWRFFHNGLPDAINLWRRGVTVDRSCKLCGAPEETALHVITECWWAKALFSKFNLSMPCFQTVIRSPVDWLWWCVMRLSDDDRRKLFIVMWLCWRNRNNIWHDKGGWDISQASIIGKNTLRLLNCWHVTQSSRNSIFSDTWTPPPQNVIKINIDGAWEMNSREAGLGIVARDHLGTVLWTRAVHQRKGMCSSEVEGQALLLGLKLALAMKLKAVLFETDSLDVFRAVTLGAVLADWCEPRLEEVIDIFRLKPSWSLQAISREANSIADWLATKARSSPWCWERMDAIPWFPKSLF
ncbi:hypothetical protein QQ045_029716 [Rhodiola kirilowii]